MHRWGPNLGSDKKAIVTDAGRTQLDCNGMNGKEKKGLLHCVDRYLGLCFAQKRAHGIAEYIHQYETYQDHTCVALGSLILVKVT